MKQHLLEFICKQQTALTNLPLNIYREQKLLQSYNGFSSSFVLFDDIIRKLLSSDRKALLVVTPELLQFGMIREKENGFILIVGPVKSIEISLNDMRALALQNKIPLDQIPELTSKLSNAFSMSPGSFLMFLQLLYAIVNEEIIPESEMIDTEADTLLKKAVNSEFTKSGEAVVYGEKTKPVPYEYESKMLYYISHGMVERLRSFNTSNLVEAVGKTAKETIRHNKNIVLISNSLASRAAIKGGLNAEAVYRLAEIYAQKIEACNNIPELMKLSQHLRMDYCTRVRNNQYEQIEDLIIGKTVRYIHDHLTEKISCPDIAAYLHITPEYLSAKFKKTMHKTLVEFINEQKIKEAQYLLLYSNESLSTISNYLSFSSQPYFQSLFKKYTGMTPLEFRDKKEELTS